MDAPSIDNSLLEQIDSREENFGCLALPFDTSNRFRPCLPAADGTIQIVTVGDRTGLVVGLSLEARGLYLTMEASAARTWSVALARAADILDNGRGKQ